MSFVNDFTRDYAAIKRNNSESDATIDNINERLTVAEAEIVSLDIRVTANTVAIAALDIRLTTAEGKIDVLRIDLDQLRLELDGHVSSTEAHGSLGDIVGTDNYATLILGGTVKLAASVNDANPVSASPPASVGGAPALYDQSYANSQTSAINDLSSAVSATVSDANLAIAQLNLLMQSMRDALQLEP